MNAVDQAFATQLKNIQTKTGKTLDQLFAIIRASGLSKHGEIRDMLKRELGLGHGDANTLTTQALKAASGASGGAQQPSSPDAIEESLYSGAKSALRPIHVKVMKAIHGLGPFEISPKKTYLSLRRKKQFAMVGPATNTRVEVGLNMKGIPATPRLEALPPGGMCQYRVKLTSVEEVNDELLGWIRQAYEGAD